MTNRPLLILPTAPDRWRALDELLAHESEIRREDIRKRLVEGVERARDAFAIIPDGSKAVACACIRRRGDIGVIGQLYTSDSHRRRGFARSLLQTLLSWFDMTGGKRLYAHTKLELYQGFGEHFGFQVLQNVDRNGTPYATLVRTPRGIDPNEYVSSDGGVTTRPVSRCDWPLIVAMLQHAPGADPRVPLPESALAAENAVFDLIAQQEAGTCRLLAACRGKRIVALASFATDRVGDRTHAMIMPHADPPAELRQAVAEMAQTESYTHVEYPLEALAPADAATVSPEADAAASPDATET